MEFAKVIATAPTAPTAPPSYDNANTRQPYQNESIQKQWPTQSAYPHPQPSVNSSYPVQSHTGYPQSHQYPTHPQTGYPPQSYQRPGQVVITQAPTTIVKPPDFTNSVPPLGDHPSMTRCLRCNTQIVTNVEYYNSNVTHCIAGVLCLTAWYCCCCFLPYCFNGSKSVRHYCPQCKTLIGSYDRKMC